MFKFLKKFLSRKFLAIIVGSAADILIVISAIPPDMKPLLISLVSGLSGLYVVVEGIIDCIKEERPD